MSIIIFDGPDMCGKTEMSKALSDLLDIPYYKNENEWAAFVNDPSYFTNALKYGDVFFYDFLYKTSTSVILDRSYPSEWVYPQVFNRPKDDATLRHVDTMAARAGAKIIIPFRVSYSGITDDVHDISSKQLSDIDYYYTKFAEWTQCETLHLPVDDEDLGREIKDITQFLKEEVEHG